MAYLWQLWPGRGWPLDDREEASLVADWADRARGTGTVRRDALIVALGGIRCGSSAQQLIAAAPGISPADLLASYLHLDRLRQDAVDAFTRACQAGEVREFKSQAKKAAALLPAPVEILRTTLRLNGLAGLNEASGRVLHRSELIRSEVDEVYLLLRQSEDPVRLGRILFDPYNSGLWGDPYFAARRAGELTPIRVRTLLGEDPHSDLIFTDVHDISPDTDRH